VVTSGRSGYLFGLAAYGLWGAFPLYFPLLEPGSPWEILAHRIVWSCLTMALLLVLLRRTTQFRAILRDRRVRLLLTVAAIVITVNWGGFILGTTTGRVVEVSLGYFINPLVTVLMGVLILGERLRPAQWAAIGIGLLACGVLTWDYGRLPWIALVLAFSFGTYGLVKKSADTGAVESLTFETLLLGPFALGFLLWLGSTGNGQFTSAGWSHVLLLMSAGIVTAVPLLCFSAAATRIPMTALGLMQYLTPTLQFLIGITIAGEEMPPTRWAGFALVWLALSIFTADALRARRRQLALVAESTAT
jgi:chloramphenicol-sensitive protein RarD